MQVEKDKVVNFFYTLAEKDGPELENNSETIPMAYLHGYNNILKGLEDALAGLSEGDTKEVTLSPEQAYGEPVAGAEQRIPIKHLVSTHKRLLPGTFVKIQTDKGQRDGKVIKAGKFMVTVDLNHPFAGKTLIFKVSIESIREATADEMAHGHAHGAGGHHH